MDSNSSFLASLERAVALFFVPGEANSRRAMADQGRPCAPFCLFAALLMVLACSCYSRPNEKPDVELPAWLTQEKTTPVQTVSAIEEAPSAQLGLNLKVGEQFPLRKVVQQELIQGSVSGEPVRNYSQLELMMAITVLAREQERTKLGVRYHRVKYQHEIADEHVEFDSSNSAGAVSPGVQAYRDMVNDGFSFWVGADNQIVEVEGLPEFINRCLRNIPPAQRKDVVLGIEAGSGESGIANFVDNTIGLLPYGRRTSPGDTWDRQQQISRPVPMHVTNSYTLKELTDHLAVIDIRGAITPSTTFNAMGGENGVQVIVNGGNTLGSCTIYRDTGLPKESRVDRVVDMTVVMENAVSFRQQKRVTTTVESFPAAGSPPAVANELTPGTIQQTGGEMPLINRRPASP